MFLKPSMMVKYAVATISIHLITVDICLATLTHITEVWRSVDTEAFSCHTQNTESHNSKIGNISGCERIEFLHLHYFLYHTVKFIDGICAA